jgi:hypothetical protein
MIGRQTRTGAAALLRVWAFCSILWAGLEIKLLLFLNRENGDRLAESRSL